ncbi:MAG: diaminopimelate decarboxylase [Gammaproteobacteria bacterium]|nr:diaminopimelate decarboxylase [Gammaproteobacteria bacterium]
MDHFEYRDGLLYAEDVPLPRIADNCGTPCFVYSRATLERHWRVYDEAFADYPHLICYAVKANANLGVLDVLARLGSGFDIVSGGELGRVLQARGEPGKVIFSGVGKHPEEMRAALAAGIFCFNVESAQELEQLAELARETGTPAPVALRVNPEVDVRTHPYIATGLRENKFGVTVDEARVLYRKAAASPHLVVRGIACHIGSQLVDLDPLLDALNRLLDLVAELEREQKPGFSHLDMGGGLGVRYRDETPPAPADYARALVELLRERGSSLRLLVEPGRSIAGNAGVLLTRVRYLKQQAAKNFAVVDAGMNDLARPSLYDAWHDIVPVVPRSGEARAWDVVGPVCESGDFLGRDRELVLEAGDLVAVRTAGAYGFTMSSNYNSRPRAAEVMVDGDRWHLVRERERFEDLVRGEKRLPDEPGGG